MNKNLKNMEYEKKWAIGKKDFSTIKEIIGEPKKEIGIIQTYLPTESKNSEKRIRKIITLKSSKQNTKYVLTKKFGTGDTREEIEKTISKEEYLKLKNEKTIGLLKKVRSIHEYKGYNIEIDHYLELDLDSPIIEIEFDNKKEMQEFNINKLFNNIDAIDVTEKKEFKNKNIATGKGLTEVKYIFDFLNRN